MNPNHLKAALIVSILLSWIVIGLNLYSIWAAGPSGSGPDAFAGLNTTEVVVGGEDGSGGNKGNIVEQLFSDEAVERVSPCDHIKEGQILVTETGVNIDMKDAEWATFTDTNSMDPVIDAGANAIEFVPSSEKDICVGDIVSYTSDYASGTIIHRIVETGYDSDGWYAIFKGDNLAYRDPEKVRFSQIKRVVVAIIY
jgi:hypothetical protein